MDRQLVGVRLEKENCGGGEKGDGGKIQSAGKKDMAAKSQKSS